jgi:hypothetical protein
MVVWGLIGGGDEPISIEIGAPSVRLAGMRSIISRYSPFSELISFESCTITGPRVSITTRDVPGLKRP